jgi:hypothetical protein
MSSHLQILRLKTKDAEHHFSSFKEKFTIQKQEYNSMGLSSLKLARMMWLAARDEHLERYQARLAETAILERSLLKQQQQQLREYSDALGPADAGEHDMEILDSFQSQLTRQRLIRPEHFKRRPVPLPMPQQLSQRFSKSLFKPQQSSQSQFSKSLWDTSEYKRTLVVSLRQKLLLKTVFQAWRVMRMRTSIFHQCSTSAQRQRPMRELQLCFSALILEMHEARCTRAAAEHRASIFLLHRHAGLALRRMHRRCIARRQEQRRLLASQRFWANGLKRYGSRLLRWNALYSRGMRVKEVWARHR